MGNILLKILKMLFKLRKYFSNSPKVEANIVSVERIEKYITDLAQEKPRTLPRDETLPSNWPARGSIEFKNFSARYRDELPLVMKDISINIKEGEKIGICGRTGAGKSSLTVALFSLGCPRNFYKSTLKMQKFVDTLV